MRAAQRIAIIGGRSAVAERLREGPLRAAVAFVRDAPKGDERLVRDYGAVEAKDLADFDVVINCAGATAGSEAVLERANVALVRHLAGVCRSAGVRRFVHVSSFSVLGDATRVDRGTRVAPITAYGRSKARGEQIIHDAAKQGLGAAILRLPAIVSLRRPTGKIPRLLRVWRRTRLLPVPAGDIRRTMISDTLAADAVAELAAGNDVGIVFAGDPEPFSYALARVAMHAAGLGQTGIVEVPAIALRPLRVLAPDYHRSLYGDCELAPEANLLANSQGDLFAVLGAIARAA